MSGVVICQIFGPKDPVKPRDPRFEHREDCPAHGFLSLKNARYFKRMGWCRCDVPMEEA